MNSVELIHCFIQLFLTILSIKAMTELMEFFNLSILSCNCECAGLRDKVLVDSYILARLLTIAALLDASERRLCRG